MLPLLRDLMAHAEWADAVYLHAWGGSPARDHDELRERFTHIVGVQHAFLMILRGETVTAPPPGPLRPYDGLKAWARDCHAEWRAWLDAADEAALARSVRVPWFPDPPCVISVGQAVVQVAMHSQHHRGQCMTRLKALGGTPRNVDWIIWLWKQKPAGRWS
jgi:uncharacterized damage-inducible protein DinB